jgi:hypothetical protein
MKMLKRSMVGLFGVVLLAGCVPFSGRVGGDWFNPIKLETTNIAQVVPGATWYVMVPVNPNAVDIPRKVFDDNVQINLVSPQKGDSVTARIDAYASVSIAEVRLAGQPLPEGWGVGLYAITGRSTVTDTDERYVYYSSRAEFTLAITVPASARSGVYPVQVTLRGSTGKTYPVVFGLQIGTTSAGTSQG